MLHLGLLPLNASAGDGPPATVGLNAGDNVTAVNVTGSNTNDVINIEQTSNIGVEGVWAFRVNGAEILGMLSDHDKFWQNSYSTPLGKDHVQGHIELRLENDALSWMYVQ